MEKPERDAQETLPEPPERVDVMMARALEEPPALDDTHELRRRALIREALFGGDGAAPTRIGRFTLEKPLGAGGMGVVYAALDEQLDRRVALKLVRTRGDGEERARLLREAQALARLSHPNVVTVFEAGFHDDKLFVAMELVHGQTLAAWRSEAPRSSREAVAVYLQAGRGLAAAHAAGLVHRDFKPQNAMIDVAGRVRVLDFGLVRWTHEAAPHEGGEGGVGAAPGPHTITAEGTVMGTPAYMAPEQLDGARVDARADQLAFCVALFEALCGERPFPGSTLEEVRESMRAGRMRRPPAWAKLPAHVRRGLTRGLAEAPADRWPTLEALLATLAPAQWSARRTALVAMACAALLGGAAAAARLGGKDARCREVAATTALAWGAPERARVERVFGDAPETYARDGWPRVAAGLDGYSAALAEASRAACLAVESGAPATEQDYARMACVQRRRDDLRALVEVLAEGGEGVAARGVEAVLGLVPVTACADAAGLGAEARPPAEPALAARVAGLRRELSRSAADERAGRSEQSLARARVVVGQTASIPYRAVVAEALREQGYAELSLAQPSDAVRSFERAYAEAIAAGHDAVAADAAREIYLALGVAMAKPEAAAPWEQTAEAFAERLRGLRRFRGAFLNARALVRDRQGKLPEAMRDYEDALAILEEVWGPDDLRLATVLTNMVRATEARGDMDAAERFAARALSIREKSLGPDHPRVARTLTNLALVVLHRGQVDRAVEALQRATSIFERALSPSHPDLAVALGHLCDALLQRRETEPAIAGCERSLRVLEARGGPAAGNVAEVQHTLARALHARGQASDRARIEALVASAAEAYRREGEGSRADLEELLAWARDNGVPTGPRDAR
jgi:tetratricopeptide (TPR) repeat protein/predicted Ser/Thr protein kinase